MSRKLTVLLTEDEDLRLDQYCREQGFKKSTLVARLIREHLNREGFRVQKDLFEGSGRPRGGGRDRRG